MKGEIIIEATRGALIPEPNEIDPGNLSWKPDGLSLHRAIFPDGDETMLFAEYGSETEAVLTFSTLLYRDPAKARIERDGDELTIHFPD